MTYYLFIHSILASLHSRCRFENIWILYQNYVCFRLASSPHPQLLIKIFQRSGYPISVYNYSFSHFKRALSFFLLWLFVGMLFLQNILTLPHLVWRSVYSGAYWGCLRRQNPGGVVSGYVKLQSLWRWWKNLWLVLTSKHPKLCQI